jgi:hypothetical protein
MANQESPSTRIRLDTNESAPESAPNAGLCSFERLLNFSVPANGNMANEDSKRKTARQIACVRCHAQKLRCIRKAGQTCDRCLAANLDGVARQLQRMGRPVDHHRKSTTNSTRSRHKLSYRGSNHTNGVARSSGLATLSDNDRDVGADITASAVSYNEIENSMAMSSDTRRGQTENYGSSSNSTIMTQLPASHAASEMDIWPRWPSSLTLTSYADSLMAGLDDPDSLFPYYDELPVELFSHGTDSARDGSIANLNNTESLQSPFEPPLGDSVEQISKFHHELYQCLTSVRMVEKLKKEKLGNMSQQVVEIDTCWLQQLFRTSDRFTEALEGYVSNNFTNTISTTIATATSNDQPDIIHEVETATGLMIVSCYMRILKIMEVVVFIIETYRDFDCPGSYVEVTFGSFIPKTDKALSARFLGQYVLHILDGNSKAVYKAIASRQPYARVIAESKTVEAKLKERISTALQ